MPPPRTLSPFAAARFRFATVVLVTFSADAGFALKAPFPGRDQDTFGVGFGVAKVSSQAAALDKDTDFYSGRPYPVRSAETFIEVTYQLPLTPWWLLQPDFQYFFLPGGGIPNPNNPGSRVGNEAVFGLRTNITF